MYRTTRESVDEMTGLLQGHGIRALPYHAGLIDDTRKRNQEAFNRDEIEVMVATIAFGMGIDKSNVRFVIHADLPRSMEAYYQETGRAGRDGEPARCLLLFSRGDIPKIRYFIDQISEESERRRSLAALNEMVNYAAAGQTCRRTKNPGLFRRDLRQGPVRGLRPLQRGDGDGGSDHGCADDPLRHGPNPRAFRRRTHHRHREGRRHQEDPWISTPGASDLRCRQVQGQAALATGRRRPSVPGYHHPVPGGVADPGTHDTGPRSAERPTRGYRS